MNKYDRRLKQVIDYLASHWLNPDVGIVGAGIFHPLRPPVFATSRQVENGKWLHAEANAIFQYKSKYGFLNKDIVMVTTLSPCLKSISDSRVGCCCTYILQKNNIQRVHTGALDENQGTNVIREYKECGLCVTLSEDQTCKTVCENLRGIFERYGNRINYDLLSIKKEVLKNIL